MAKGPPAGDISNVGSVPGLGRCPGGGHGNPLQYFCLETPLDRGAWWATVHGVTRVRHGLVTKPPPPPPSTTLAETMVRTLILKPALSSES